MGSVWLRLVVVMTVFKGYVYANNWMIDESCGKVGTDKYKFVQTAFANAQLMAQAGYDVSLQPTPALQSVITMLFGPTGAPQHFQTHAYNTLSTRAGALRFNNPVRDKGLLGVDDLKIYCDMSRMHRRADLRYADTDLPVPSTMDGEIITQCNLLNAVVGSIPPLMWTAQPKKPVQPGEPEEPQFWQIQICPFFLSFAMHQTYQWTVYLQPQMWPRILVNQAVALYAKIKYAPIDALSLIDKVFLHELTHAHNDPAVVTDDLRINGGPAYGWTNCRAISTIVTDTSQDPEVKGPELNADTWALYGSIAWQLGAGYITAVLPNGSVTTP